MELKPALEKLFSLHQFGIKLGLENTLKLLEQIGNPHLGLKCFHVAGSNGKGSTASFLASILMEHGFNVGLYTSPHFVRFNERIKVNGKEIPDEAIVEFVSKLDEYIDKEKPTFFELTTALAFKYFETQKVDYAVIETGLGGRLDATNVIDPVASIITSISLEHTAHLGDTLEKVAFEKAGIIKKGKPVFTGTLPSEAEKVITQKAIEMGSQVYRANDFIFQDKDCLKVQTHLAQFNIYETPLRGIHQLNNAALAMKTVTETIHKISFVSVAKGISKVIENTKIEGRYEIYNTEPKIIFDSAHNPEGVESFLNEFKKEYAAYSERVLIFGAMRDKNIKTMLSNLAPYFTKIFFTSIDDERAAKYSEMAELLKGTEIELEPLSEPGQYISLFKAKRENSCMVLLGSMYLLGEIKAKILEKRLDIKTGGV
ncbi:MAG: bifunctional folylpolyglutamate synthase/dihydrofolate synthase [Ignavibacteriales bacterium]|nr:bifunctional folylpolyglutamate synthase/dihydrofolate synthase [Ignavibacteriales bacterium]